MPRILRAKEARLKIGLSKTTFTEKVAAGLLPQPVTIIEGGRSIGFLDDELDAHLEARRKARDKELAERGEQPPPPPKRPVGRPRKPEPGTPQPTTARP
jgi:predicted DNA-binding transcriptional regulator AlpA